VKINQLKKNYDILKDEIIESKKFQPEEEKIE